MDTCPHPIITVYLRRIPPTLWEPGETVGFGMCDECGKKLDLDDIPEGSETRDEYGRKVEL